MQRIITLTERKTAAAARRAAAVEAIVPVLSAYARDHGGRFLLFGSAARGQMKFDSDVDLLMDFPPETLDEAWKFAETACWDRNLKPDLIPYRWCKKAFLEHVDTDIKVLA